jgi:hypothetical protein
MTAAMATVLVASQTRQFCATAIGRSTHTFVEYFQALRQEPLNPVQRVVFSLALANANSHQACKPPLHS